MTHKQTQKVKIRTAESGDLDTLWGIIGAVSSSGKEVGYFERQLAYQAGDNRVVFIAGTAEGDAGYCILNWEPKYAFFRKLNIPEIQDLNVLPAFRRRGIAAQIIGYCEAEARGKGYADIGISVGLHERFGAAQRLYIKLGYVPDGNGVTYDRKPVVPGEIRAIDDNLCLMMVKSLQEKG